MVEKYHFQTLILYLLVLPVCTNGDILVLSDGAPNISIEVLSDTQVKLTNHNLSVGYAVDVYNKDGVFEPNHSLTENELLGIGLFGGFFGTKTKTITLPDSPPSTTVRLEIYAKILPEGHPRLEFSRRVALKNMDAAFAGVISNILGVLGVVAEAPKVAEFASDLISTSGASGEFLDDDIANGFDKLATWAASKVGKAGILIAAQKLGMTTISASTASCIGGMVAVAFTLPTVWDVVWYPDLYHSVTLLRTVDLAPSYYFTSNGGGVEPSQCMKDWIPTFNIGDDWCFFYNVTNRSSNPLYNVSLKASLYGPEETLVEHSAVGGGFNLVWNYPPEYPEYWDFDPYGDPWCQGSVGLHQSCYQLAVSSTGRQYQGGLYRLEAELKGSYGTDTLGSDSHWIRILDGQVPGGPQQITGEAVGDDIVVSWRPPANTYDIFLYVARRFDNPHRTGQPRVFTIRVPDREEPSGKLTKAAPYLLDETAQPGVTYYYEVRITDWDDLSSEWSPLYGPLTIGLRDPCESDDTHGEGNWIYDGVFQTHSIVPANDVDWVKFSLGSKSEVIIETSGAAGDTRICLYDGSLTELECNDDGGTGLFSRIDRVCGTDALPAGTYYVKIEEYENDDQVTSYTINLTVTACTDGNHDPQLSNGSVDPNSGDTNIDFYWFVDYYDEDGGVPSIRKVYIDGTPYTMSLYSGTFSNGTYSYGPRRLSEGLHDYYLYFRDGSGSEIRLPTNGTYTNPIVSASTGEPDLIATDTIVPTTDQWLPFNSVQVGGSKVATVTLTNQGQGAITVQGIPSSLQPGIWVGDYGDGDSVAYSLTFPDDPDGDGEFVIQPGESQNVVVTFSPTEIRTYDAWLKVNSNDPDYPDGFFITLDGAGIDSSSSDIIMVGAYHDHAGSSLSSAGDVNGDGYDDLLIGAPDADIGAGLKVGRAYLIYGGPNLDTSIDLLSQANFIMEGIINYDNLGNRVSSGDFNGDGVSDLAIGAYGNAVGLRTYIIYGRSDLSGTISSNNADLALQGPSAEHTGSLSLSGDLNGDGYDDLIIGNQGRVRIIMGRAGLTGVLDVQTSPDVTINGVGGEAATHAGDVDGDGLCDIIIDGGSPAGQGGAYLFLGRHTWVNSLDASDANCHLQSVGYDYYIGSDLAGMGDINGDGYDDLLIGARAMSSSGKGNVYIVYGKSIWSDSMLVTNSDVIIFGANNEDDFFGRVVDGSGDFNADGYSDILLGASNSDINGNNSGEAYLIYGRGNLSSTIMMPADADGHWTGAALTRLGSAMVSAGDIDRDGRADMTISAPSAASSAGETYLIRGGTTTPVTPPRLKPDLSILAISGDTLISPDNSLNLNVSVENTGPGPAHSYKIGCYLSDDQNLEKDSDTLLGYIPMGRLGTGETDNGHMLTNSPNVSDGLYFIVACVDVMNENAEGDETNNLGTRPIGMDGRPPYVENCFVGGASEQQVDELTVLFDSPVSVDVDDVTITHPASAQLIPFKLEYSDRTLTLYLKQSLPQGKHDLTLKAAGISDLAGNLLDGNGDAVGGDDYSFTFSVTIGDFCGASFGPPDGYVDVWDLMEFASHWHTRTGDGNWDVTFDLAGPNFSDPDGYIDVWDLMTFADHWHEGERP